MSLFNSVGTPGPKKIITNPNNTIAGKDTKNPSATGSTQANQGQGNRAKGDTGKNTGTAKQWKNKAHSTKGSEKPKAKENLEIPEESKDPDMVDNPITRELKKEAPEETSQELEKDNRSIQERAKEILDSLKDQKDLEQRGKDFRKIRKEHPNRDNDELMKELMKDQDFRNWMQYEDALDRIKNIRNLMVQGY